MSARAGTLHCTVEYARGLLDKEWFGKQDPYAVLELGGQAFRTKTHKDGGTSPVWAETFTFNVNAEAELVVTVKDENWGKDKLLGSTTVSLATVRARGEDPVQAPLQEGRNRKQKGVVSLLLKFTPAGATPVVGAGGFPPTQQPPLQQAGVRITMLPGYGTFPTASQPQAPSNGSPYGVPAGAVYGQPSTVTGTPSPYSPYPPSAPPALQPQLNGVSPGPVSPPGPYAFRAAPVPSTSGPAETPRPAPDSAEAGTCASAGLGSTVSGADAASAARVPPPPPPPPAAPLHLQALRVEDACDGPLKGPCRPPLKSPVGDCATAEATAGPVDSPGRKHRGPPVWESGASATATADLLGKPLQPSPEEAAAAAATVEQVGARERPPAPVQESPEPAGKAADLEQTAAAAAVPAASGAAVAAESVPEGPVGAQHASAGNAEANVTGPASGAGVAGIRAGTTPATFATAATATAGGGAAVVSVPCRAQYPRRRRCEGTRAV